MKIIAICMNLPECQTDFRDVKVGKKYPGAGFLPELAKLCDQEQVTLMGGEEVLKLVAQKQIQPQDVYILQEELNSSGLHLLEAGAHPQVLFCMESKMYAPIFYDAVPELKKVFRYQILFEGGTHRMKFPSYSPEETKYGYRVGAERKEMCMIASNKQWWSLFPIWSSPSFCEAIRNELHTERLRAIADNPHMDIYGPGWDNLSNLPPQWAFLKPRIEKQWMGVVNDKLEILSHYKKTVCFENSHLSGYMTEKPIHAWVCGTEAIYKTPPHVLETSHWEHSYESFARALMGLLS